MRQQAIEIFAVALVCTVIYFAMGCWRHHQDTRPPVIEVDTTPLGNL